MDITAITSEITAGARMHAADVQPAAVGKEFEALLCEMLLKSSGFSAALAGGGESGPETALFGDLAIQVLASELARDLDLGVGQTVTTKHK